MLFGINKCIAFMCQVLIQVLCNVNSFTLSKQPDEVGCSSSHFTDEETEAVISPKASS